MQSLTRLFIAIILFGSAGALAAEADVTGFSLWHAQTNAYYAFQQSGGNSYSLQLAFTPHWHFSERFYLRANLGAVPLKASSSAIFIAYNGQLLVGAKKLYSNLGLEFGGGVETWIEPGKIYPLIGLNLVWLFDQTILKFIDRAFLGFSNLMLSDFNSTYEIKGGIGLSF